MSTQEDETVLLKSINGILQSVKLYPPGHPSIAGPIKNITQKIISRLARVPKVSIAYIGEALIFEEVPVPDPENFEDVITLMSDRDIESITFEKGVNSREFTEFVNLITDDLGTKAEEIQEELTKRAVKKIVIKEITEEQNDFIRVYNDALTAIKNVMGEVRLGKIPQTEKVTEVVDEMSDMVLANSNAMLGLTMIKNYDEYLFNHSVNVSIISLSFAKYLKLSEKDIHAIGMGSLLHDIGKTGVAEDIIKKPGGLSTEEWEKVKEHPVIGGKIIERMADIPDGVHNIVYEHHIRHDHSGYPKSNKRVHPLAMIVCIADAYDALTTLRVYQKPYQPVEAVKVLKKMSGKHFEPTMIEGFEKMLGLYPVGTMVRLSTNEIGIVTKLNEEEGGTPFVKIICDKDGNKTTEEIEIEMGKENNDSGNLFIVAPVDPLSRNMDMGEFFIEEVGKLDSPEKKEERGTA